MNTPIADFVKGYAESKVSRLHMPGHKGIPILGCEPLDITEITGADELFSPEGIIRESENNAARLFGTKQTVYSAGGSTQSIHAMLYLAYISRKKRNASSAVLAGRNAHKAFIYAAAKLDADIEWLLPEKACCLCSCTVTAEQLEKKLLHMSEKPFAVYITSPDYLGGTTDIKALSAACKRLDIPLLVDNAHGAYRAFLEDSAHPVQLGADACCDSAHKTLPVLTGGGYLHIAADDKYGFSENAVRAMELFGSTSPSYLILQSLDLCNKYLAGGFRGDLSECVQQTAKIKALMKKLNIPDISREPIKITADFSLFEKPRCGWAELFRKNGIEPEFCDRERVVLMLSPQNSRRDYERLIQTLRNIAPLTEMPKEPAAEALPCPFRKISVREAIFSPQETVAAECSAGRICGAPTVSCPPAVPIAVSGEEITDEHIRLFKKYGINRISVVK